MINEDDQITVKTAYAAMYKFLENEYELTSSGDIGGLLGGMSLLRILIYLNTDSGRT